MKVKDFNEFVGTLTENTKQVDEAVSRDSILKRLSAANKSIIKIRDMVNTKALSNTLGKMVANHESGSKSAKDLKDLYSLLFKAGNLSDKITKDFLKNK